jgi:cytochrome P450
VSSLKEIMTRPALSIAQTVSALYTFYLAMTLFPDIQTKAQDEIDRVVGNDRLPILADRDSLPYISALHSEIYRWRPVAPFGSSTA